MNRRGIHGSTALLRPPALAQPTPLSRIEGNRMKRNRLGATALAVALVSLWGQVQAATAWREGVAYAAGTVVTYAGRDYVALVSHTAWAGSGWNPAATASLWRASAQAPAPAPSPSPSPSPSPAPSPAPSPGACFTAWSAASAYTGGATVTRGGTNYRANWWTQGDDPATQSGPSGSGKPWTVLSACAGTPAPAPAPSPSPSPSPAPAPTPAPAPAPSPSDPLTVGDAVKAVQTKRVYVGYYPSWSDNWFDATGKSANDVYRASKFARIPGTYTHVMAAFADPNFSWAGLAANSFSGTGMSFNATPRDIKAAIDVLHQRNMKVILAVGGATYGNWGPLAAEGQRGSGPITSALARFISEMGFDGLDVDYEVDGDVDRYANSIKALRAAVDQAGGGRLLTLAGWSTGADCTAQTAADPSCAGKLSYWGGNAGRERAVVLKYPAIAGMLDMVNVMSYDARFEHYDGVVAYNDYRNLFPARTIVSMGLESAPEGWAGANLVINNADAQCEGSRLLQDQYGAVINAPYSVERYTGAVLASSSSKRNPRDGAMLWAIIKPTVGNCGSAPLAAPGTIGAKVGSTFGLPVDPLLRAAEWK
jgi:chitodextrinase